MKVLILDNYDSFTFNLYQYTGEILADTQRQFKLDVVRNDEITIGEIAKKGYQRIIISPGPGTVTERAYFGVSAEVITKTGKEIPVLGVCLGMQGIMHYYGGKIIRAKQPMHGKTSLIKHDNMGIFKGLPQTIEVMRYHSLIADKTTLPDCLKITATTLDTEEIMGLRHTKYPIEGVQFHPESFATDGGKLLMTNFLTQER